MHKTDSFCDNKHQTSIVKPSESQTQNSLLRIASLLRRPEDQSLIEDGSTTTSQNSKPLLSAVTLPDVVMEEPLSGRRRDVGRTPRYCESVNAGVRRSTVYLSGSRAVQELHANWSRAAYSYDMPKPAAAELQEPSVTSRKTSCFLSMDLCVPENDDVQHAGNLNNTNLNAARSFHKYESSTVKSVYKLDGNVFVANEHFWGVVRVWPLGFKSWRLERRYVASIAAGCELRTKIAGCILLFVSTILWILYGIVSFPHVFTDHSTNNIVMIWNIGNAFLMLSGVIIVSMSQLAFLNTHREVLLSLLIIPIYVFWAGWSGACFRIFKGLPASSRLISIFSFKYFMDPVFVFLFFAMLTIFDNLLHFRTKWSASAAGILFGMYALTRVFQGFALNNSEHIGAGNLLAFEACQCLFVLLVTGICLIGQNQREVAERVAFLAVQEDQKRLQDLRETHRRRKTLGGETILEGLIHDLRRASVDLQEATYNGSSVGDSRLIECDEILHQCIECLLSVNALHQSQVMKNNVNELTTNVRNGFSGSGSNSQLTRMMGQDLTTSELEQAEYYTPQKIPPLIISSEVQSKIGSDPSLDTLALWSTTPHIVVEFGMVLLSTWLSNLKTDVLTLQKYLLQLESKYWDNPYHNACHGATVAHMFTCIVNALGYRFLLSPLDLASAILACIAHDVGHPGRNNSFHIQSEHTVALVYNDIAVLEKYHSFLCFRLAHVGREVNVFGNLKQSEYNQARKQIIAIILCTDMSEHFPSISKYRIRRNAVDFDPCKNPQDIAATVKLSAKLADLSHTLVAWDQHVRWSFRVTEEFYKQGEDESELGLPISPLCNRAVHGEFAKSQQGFIQFVVLVVSLCLQVVSLCLQPLITELCEIAPNAGFKPLQAAFHYRTHGE
eukprot:Gregarina_sp_Poly_1__3155@NODE_1894_length_3127_cov_44_840850_g45_i1_p1_GENE_NODE_1894_length_3127_cov_44_840850_g45_i1NODE_1894_length_3127_cov_44_840850_g45_i1_p1_ORF_typecomplete_len896_score99_91PDEase_I/PF00233_19/1_1e63HD/PF01966_22/0_0091_NODE_1894_length_3127_cov_44_840850_g45_i14163103